MALATEHRVSGIPFAAQVRAAIAALGEKYTRYSLYTKTLREMNELSDRELNDLGLSRAQLKQVAKQAVYEA